MSNDSSFATATATTAAVRCGRRVFQDADVIVLAGARAGGGSGSWPSRAGATLPEAASMNDSTGMKMQQFMLINTVRSSRTQSESRLSLAFLYTPSSSSIRVKHLPLLATYTQGGTRHCCSLIIVDSSSFFP